MMPARWARGATPPRIAAGACLLAVTGLLTGCGMIPYAAPPAVVPGASYGAALDAAPPAANAANAGDPDDPCPYLSSAEVASLAGDQRTQLVGSASACSFNIGGQFIYQLDVMTNDNDRFADDRTRFFNDAKAVAGVGDEAFFRDGTGLTVLGARKGNSYFTVTLVPAVADPNGGSGAGAPSAAPEAADPNAALAAKIDANDDGIADADTDEDGLVDDDAPRAAANAADANGDGKIDNSVAAALAGKARVVAKNAAPAGGKNAPVTDIASAKARMTDVAKAVVNSL